MTTKQQQLLKRLAGLAFAISFLMAIVLFTRTGTQYISFITAKYVFIISGAIALFLNLINFQASKHNPIYSLTYWSGSIVLFVGLIFFLMRWPYGFYIIITGLAITGLSFLIPADAKIEKNESDRDILDNF